MKYKVLNVFIYHKNMNYDYILQLKQAKTFKVI